ncbi:hypothetical protein [Nitratifractor salsuginis]|uniref:Uncharacterized protein n=1 Tax=Nitratifractor salsuginis (strain DSM 16511 / JCM 12458 / E9I37-1) TaxID=749222 RepID=E6WZ98_NITSE|nr:hypothetical protein [Nitratifractor salsuginis]ADV46610.1 hypothetical protein Nitsa_1359 [Nitratifractor salsuginis DSM 16511]
MIRRAFLPVISALLLQAGGRGECPDDYTPASFEEASDELLDFVDEYFTDAKLPFLPSKSDLKRLGLVRIKPGLYQRPDAMIQSGRRRYPYRSGIWRVEFPGEGITIVHLLLKEPRQLSESEAFNTINDSVGDLFADYDNRAYILRMLPEDVRQKVGDKYITLNVHVYGVRDDATELNTTVADYILTDYSKLVGKYLECVKKP